MFVCMRFQEVRGHWPWSKGKKVVDADDVEGSSAKSEGSAADEKAGEVVEMTVPVRTVE